MANAVATQDQRIEESIDKRAAGALAISREAGGMAFHNMGEVMEFAKLLAVSHQAVPPHCRGSVGICLGITIQAIEWRMSPYAVAAKSYVVNDRLSYESQLIHAVIEQRAPIRGRLRHAYIGEGETRQCKVWARPKNEEEPLVYVSPQFKTITPKNSPLWKSKPDLQLYYNASRDWARMYFPDVLLGVYAEDELDIIDSPPVARETRPQPQNRLEAIRERMAESASTVWPEPPQAAEEPQPEPELVEEPGAELPVADTPVEVPAALKSYVDAIHTAGTFDQVTAAFEKHVNSNSSLAEADYDAGCKIRDWALDRLEQRDKEKAARKSKAKGKKDELFDKGGETYQ